MEMQTEMPCAMSCKVHVAILNKTFTWCENLFFLLYVAHIECYHRRDYCCKQTKAKCYRGDDARDGRFRVSIELPDKRRITICCPYKPRSYK